MTFTDDRTIDSERIVGRHTLIPDDFVCGIRFEVGAFTSIASGCRVVSGQHPPIDHPMVVPTFPFLEHGWGDYPPSRHSGRVVVGSDVWIGENVTLLDGVTVGNGAIIGACAVVASDVPDYAVVVGNPGKVRKLRFDPEKIRALLDLRWWDWPDDQIRSQLDRLADINKLVGHISDLDVVALNAYARLANQRVSELSRFLAILRPRQPQRILEIGSQDGGTLWAWAQIAAADARILSVDWEGNVKLPDERCECIEADSHHPDTVKRVTDWFAGDPVDFLFIDGDHSYDGVRADWLNYMPLVREGGLVALHDIDGQTQHFWADIHDNFETETIIDETNRVMGIGVVYL